MEASTLRDMPLDALLLWMGRSEPNSPNHDMGMAELRLREIKLQMESSQAQIRAAEAETLAANASVKGAVAAERNAKYMFASVIVAALAVFLSAASVLVTLHPTWFK
jgi:hypothetical protein